MKIAITSTDKTLQADVDPRFGRAPYFLIVDTETDAVECIDNTAGLSAEHGAGLQAAETVAQNGASYLLTGDCGPKAMRALETAGITVVRNVAGNAGEALNNLRSGLTES